MRTQHFASAVLFACAVMALGSHAAESREPASAGTVPVHMLVTAEARHGAQVPEIKPQDVTVRQGKERVQVTDWIPMQGERSGLVRRFINLQAETTAIGVGYMRDGTVDIVQNLTTEHRQAAKALRLPLGTVGAMASPYLSISDLMKRWPETKSRREILVISDGIDRFGGVGPANPYVDAAIEQSQRAGIIVHAIYATGVGHYGHTSWRFFWGQNYLSKMASETGGEAYFLGYENPVSFAPYLEDLTRRLTHQCLLTFLARPEKKARLQSVKLWTEVPNAELVTADRVYVPARP